MEVQMLKRLEEIQAEAEKRFNQIILETEKKAKIIIHNIARDTGDMEFAVTHTLAKREGNNLVGEIFVDPGKLYNRRKPYQYKRGGRKGSYAKPQTKYPIYVHNGTDGWTGTMIAKRAKRYIGKGMQSTGYSSYTKRKSWTVNIPPMKARPYFRLAWEEIKQDKEYRDFTKDMILQEAK